MKCFFRKALPILSVLSLIWGQILAPSIILAQEINPEPTPQAEVTLAPQLSAEPSPELSLSPFPTIEPAQTSEESVLDENLTAPVASESATAIDIGIQQDVSSATVAPEIWETNADGSVTTEGDVTLNTTYTAPQNDKVTVTFTKLPESPGTVTIRENEVPKTVDNPGSKDYEITSNMPNGSFSFDLTLPTNDPNKDVLSSQDGQNYFEVSNEQISSTDTITIENITHLTHFIVGELEDGNDFGHPVINEFLSAPSPNPDQERVELYNPTSETVDLTGWVLKQLSTPNNDPDEDLFVALSGEIAAKSFIVAAGDDLNNSGDWIGLYNANGELVDQVSFGNVDDPYDVNEVDNPSSGQSTGRTIDGGPNWTIFENPTIGLSNGTTLSVLYVDSEWESPDNDGGHTWGFDAFATIQDAINFAPSGSTINVASGEYTEDLVIGQSLTLLGDAGDESAGPGENAPTIYGECTGDGEPVISIEANDVTVSGFIIIEDGCDGSNIYVNSEVSGATISDNDLSDASYYGVEIGSGSSDSQILRNLIYDNNDYGIYNYGSANTTISDNNVYNNYGGIGNGGNIGSGDISGTQITSNNIHENYSTGIYVGGVTFSELTISNNSSIDSNQGYGIYFDAVTDATLTISDNIITNNTQTGVYLSGGCTSCVTNSTVTLSGNTVSSNQGDGIYADVITDSPLFEVSDNTIEDNTGNGIYICAEGECVNSTVTIGGNGINNNDGTGIYLNDILNGSTVTIIDNNVQGNGEQSLSTGIYIYYVYNSTLDISANDILENIGDGIHIERIEEGTAEEEEDAATLVTISENLVDGNTGYGVYISEVDEDSEVTIGEDNTISDNDDAGIYLNENVAGVSIEGNTITGNGLVTDRTGIVTNSSDGNEAHNNTISGNNTGIENFDTEGSFDAAKNYWGDSSGPLNETSNSGGLGNTVGDNVLYRPFYTDSGKTVLSTSTVSPDSLSDLFTTGAFSVPSSATTGSTPSVTTNEALTINVAVTGGVHSISLPAGTVITKTDGTNLDATALTSSNVSTSTLSGLGVGVVADGALQWGIPNIGLTFSTPITLNIFVGTSLNGQTLDVRRSVDNVTWTQDGIEPPKTCTVTAGICSFQATKASFYATTHIVAVASSSNGGGGSAGPPSCNDTKPGSAPTLISAVGGTNSVTLTWSKASGEVSYYLATYGLGSGQQQYGNPNVGGSGTTTYTVQGLSGGTTYYFKLRAGNGCAPGDFSNELSATVSGGVISGPAAGFAEGVLGASTNQQSAEEGNQGEIKGETTNGQQIPGSFPGTTDVGVLGAVKNNWMWVLVGLLLLASAFFYSSRKK